MTSYQPLTTDYTYADFERIDVYPMSYQAFLDAPCRLINLDRNVHRLKKSMARIQAAGFTNVRRFKAIDARDKTELRKGWETVGFPKLAYKYDMSILTEIGVQGCALSHFAIWKDIIDNKTPYMVVFEDDILFHSHWHTHAPHYLERTPTDYDMVYIGNRNDTEKPAHIQKNRPVYCTHAYMITYNGAKKLWDMLLNLSIGIYAIDDMICGAMIGMKASHPFTNYVWNVAPFFPSNTKKMSIEWTKRNNGLVLQDENFGTDVNTTILL